MSEVDSYCLTQPVPGDYISGRCPDCGHLVAVHVGCEHCPVCEILDLAVKYRDLIAAEAPQSGDDLLSSKQVVAEYPSFGTTGHMAERRWRGVGPDYIKTSASKSGRVFYRRSSIEQWLKERVVPPKT